MIQKLEELKVYFHEADKGKSGVITPDEFLLFCQELKVPLSKETTQKLFDMTDFNKDKEMEFQEFVVVCAWEKALDCLDGVLGLIREVLCQQMP